MLALWACAGFAAICTATILAPTLPPLEGGTEAAGIILFIGVLPLLNGLADFASVGLTRYRLRKGLEGNVLGNAAQDLAWAVALFLMLGCAIIATVHWVRPQDGAPLFDLPTLFAELADPATRGQYWWLGVMMFSTLIPTLLHGVIALIAFVTLAPERWRHWIADQLHKGAGGDVLASRNGRLALTGGISVAVFLPLFLIVGGVRQAPVVVDPVIALFHAFARGIGAV